MNNLNKFWNNEGIQRFQISPENLVIHESGARVMIMETATSSNQEGYRIQVSGWMKPENAVKTIEEYSNKYVEDRMRA